MGGMHKKMCVPPLLYAPNLLSLWYETHCQEKSRRRDVVSHRNVACDDGRLPSLCRRRGGCRFSVG